MAYSSNFLALPWAKLFVPLLGISSSCAGVFLLLLPQSPPLAAAFSLTAPLKSPKLKPEIIDLSPPPSTSTPASSSDAFMNQWCTAVGIDNSNVEILTTPRSVGGRGVFTRRAIREGEIVASIPPRLVLTQRNAAREMEDVSKELQRLRRPMQEANTVRRRTRERLGQALGKVTRWLPGRRRQALPKSSADDIEDGENDEVYWQSELTLYALAALSQNHSTWSPWIQSWNRDDPTLDLFSSGVNYDDESAVNQTATQLLQMLPDVPMYMLRAALHVRLEQLDAFREQYGGLIKGVTITSMAKMSTKGERNTGKDRGALSVTSFPTVTSTTTADVMYGTLCSRAVDLGSGITGVVPLHDMINHSPDPNVAMGFDGESFKIVAARPIDAGNELLLCYNDFHNKEINQGEWDEDGAVWTLVQWGVPCPKRDWEEAQHQRQKRENIRGEWMDEAEEGA